MSRRTLASMLGTLVLAAACSTTPGATNAPATTGPATGAPASAAATQGAGPESLVIGFVPSREAEALVEDIQPLADYLSEQLDIPVKGFVSNDYTGLVTAMETGQAQIGAFAPFPMIQAMDRAGAEIILQSERFGSGTYHTQFFTNNPDKYCTVSEPEENERLVGDEDVSTMYLNCNGTARANDESPEGPIGIEALASVEEGTNVSFVEQTSSSGYIFPATVFATQGIDIESGINPIFAGAHDASVIAVCEGQAEVGVSFDDARPDADELSECPIAEEVVVFAYGPEIPNDGIVVDGDLPQETKDAIKQALLDYAESEEGQAVLESIYNITGLTEPNMESLEIVRDAVEQLDLE
jgi:phosphonate transport system substrate-binding protein